MQTPPDITEAEYEELKVVLSGMERNPRLVNLLRFLADRYFQGKSSEITEFSIATEVFGRSMDFFDGTKDSIARVEAHRLRKWLKEYYEKEGRDHAVLISLPNRSYVPNFSHQSASSAFAASNPEALPLDREKSTLEVVFKSGEALGAAKIGERNQAGQLRFGKHGWFYVAAVVSVLLLVSFSTVRFLLRHESAPARDVSSAPWPNTSQSQTPANPVHLPLRLLAGYDGSPKQDSAGEYWDADRYFQGGSAFLRPNAPVARTSDSMLFEHWRMGDFNYDIPLAPGPYELHLFFVTQQSADPLFQTFNVLINNRTVLSGFIISSDALGSNVADERVFRDVYPDSDGHLRLGFSTERSAALLNAIEILPGQPHRQLPVRLVMQREPVTDHNGNIWHPDNYYMGGWLSNIPRQVEGTPDPSIFSQERWGHFNYSIPVDTRGRYTVVLHFAEMYWGPKVSGGGGGEAGSFACSVMDNCCSTTSTYSKKQAVYTL